LSVAAPEPLRYGDPFFKPPPSSPFGTDPVAWVQTQLGPIPPPRQPAVYDLASLIGQDGAAQIEAAGSINIHAVGDTGNQQVHTEQEQVALLMKADYTGDEAHDPAFFLHLGDVIYGPNKDTEYADEFYRPYVSYPGKIIAIPGNHDGEVLPPTDPMPLEAFLANFCVATAGTPAAAASVGIARQPPNQPGVYYLLRAPFLDIVCLYSNIAEGPGSIIGAGNDTQQTTWLAATLQTIAAERAGGKRKALVFATHHPPYSSAGHGGSPDMLSDIDKACEAANITPDAHLSGHSHSYQRYTRQKGAGIPYIVAGSGGHNSTTAPDATGQQVADATYDAAYPVKATTSSGYGYLRLTVTPTSLTIDFYALGEAKSPYDSHSVTLT
jgi:hypothetical protein